MAGDIFHFSFKTVVLHGLGSSGLIGTEAVKAGISKAIVISDMGVRQAGLVRYATDSLVASGIQHQIFDGVEEDADVDVIHNITRRIKESRIDGIVVVGGGSPICAAKGAALEAANQVADVRAFEGNNRAKVPALPVICLPTTSGSGSDVSSGFPVLDKTERRHIGINDESAAPRVSILDPLLLTTCPRRQMIYSGLDALSHAVDALWAKKATPLTDSLAYQAIELIMKNLKEAALTDNLDVRMNQHLGSTLAMVAGGNSGLGIIHAFSGIHFSLKGSHGYKCGMFMPHSILFNLPVCQEKLARAAVVFGENPTNKTTAELAERFLERIILLLIDLDFPKSLDPADLVETTVDEMIQEMKRTTPDFLGSNLRTVTEEDIVKIFRDSIKGWEYLL